MLDRLRSRLDSSLTSVGSHFAKMGVPPTAWTVVGLVVSLFAAVAFYVGGLAGQVEGGILVLLAGWFDIVDGAVARVTGQTSKTGAFLDSTLDRVAEVLVFAGILVGGYSTPLVVLVALSLSLLVSYTRAKGDALGVTLSGVGIGERSERLIIIAVASIVGLTGWGVLLVAAVALFTLLERTFTAARVLSGTSQPKPISTQS